MRKRGKENDLSQRLESVHNLLHQLSYRYWRRLSVDVKIWVDEEDFFQEAVLELIRKHPLYDPGQGAWTTYVHLVVSHRLGNVVKCYMRRKRSDGVAVPVDAVDWSFSQWIPFLPADPILSCMTKLHAQ